MPNKITSLFTIDRHTKFYPVNAVSNPYTSNSALPLYNGKRLRRLLQMKKTNEAHTSQMHPYSTYRKAKQAA